jgi:hypothetical protein
LIPDILFPVPWKPSPIAKSASIHLWKEVN